MKVKNIAMALMLGSCAMSAAGQQLPNGDFSIKWVTCKPWTGTGNKTGDVGKTPSEWCVSNVYTGISNQTVANAVKGKTGPGKTAPELKNLEINLSFLGIPVQYVPAYIALGTTWNTAKGTKAENPDGGTWGGLSFSYRPDAIKFYYKRTAKDNSQPASVVAYLWKGTYEQENVPCNVVTSGSPATETMINRDRNILDNATSETLGGKVTKKGTLIAKIEGNSYAINQTATNWTECIVPLKYISEEKPEMINIIFSANDYFAPKSVVKAGNTLTIDDVELVYYHSLSSLKYNGEDVVDFDEDNLEYDLSDVTYDESKLEYTKKGVGAVVEKSYDKETAVLTLTVKGDDYNEDNEDTYTVYTIKFKKDEPQGVETAYENGLYIDARSLESGEQFDEKKSIQLVNYPELDNRYDLLLNDFVFNLNGYPLNVGDILVKDLDKEEKTGKLILSTRSQMVPVNLFGSKQELPITVNATLDGDNLTARIEIEGGLGVHVVFAPAYNLTDGLSIPTAALSNLQFTRTFRAGWNSLILPFATTVEALGAEEADQLSGLASNQNWVTFETVENGQLKANVPYLVKFAGETTPTLYYGGEVTTAGDLSNTASAVTGNGEVSFVGNYTANMDMNGKYGLYKDQIVLGGTNTYLPSTSCYFNFKNVADPSALSVKFGNGDVTSISNVNAAVSTRATGVYNLQGIKLSNDGSTAGLPAGLYIVNGQKVMVK